MKIHISFYVNYCKVLAFCFVKEVHNVLRLLLFCCKQSLPLYFFSFSIYNKVYLLSTNNIS